MKSTLFLPYLLTIIVSASGQDGFDPRLHKNWRLLPNEKCGVPMNFDRIIGGTEAPLGAYPWIARIAYRVQTVEPNFQCGAVLITETVLLTAAHCIYDNKNPLEVHYVRLGEHDTRTDPDCYKDYCAEPVQDFFPSEIIYHINYTAVNYKKDIAMIRLNKKVRFSDSVKPICLPGGRVYYQNFTGTLGEVAGWGIFNLDKIETSKTLRLVKLPIIESENCKSSFPDYLAPDSTQFCAGGNIGEDSCYGDSGGPLMKAGDGPSGPRYYLLGIVSYGPKKCGKSTTPGIYTKITQNMKWILDQL